MIKRPLITPKPIKVDSTPLYRYMRTGAFIYVEGNENPIDLKKIEATGNPTLNKQILNQNVDMLWYEKNPNTENILKLIIVVIVIAAIVYFGLQFFAARQAATATAAVLPN